MNEFKKQRLDNLKSLEDEGFVPYGNAFKRSGNLSQIRKNFEVGKNVSAAGRLMTKREMGKSIFAHIQDGSDRFQIYLKKDEVGDDVFAAFKILDLGDHIGIDGELFLTKTEETTIKVKKWILLSKSLLPLPDKWDGLQDVEARYRQRYLDLISNTKAREVFYQRIRIISETRKFLQKRGYLEVETPMMQAMAGGAAALPFQTHYQALGVDMFLRIAPELYLKRLLVGGFDKVFELNRNFRNEGLSRSHNPEFTMLEIYEAYGDISSMKELVKSLITYLAMEVFGTLQIGDVDLSQWRTVDYHTLIAEVAGNDFFDLDLENKKVRASNMGCEFLPNWNEIEVTQEISKKKLRKH